MGILTMVDAGDVVDARTFARFVQQSLGTPVPNNNNQWIALHATAKKHFEENPALNWEVMTKVVAFCRNRKRRPPTPTAIFKEIRYAWSAGYLPELDPKEQQEEQDSRIGMALLIETDAEWRRKLSTTTGEISTRMYLAWKEHRLAEI